MLEIALRMVATASDLIATALRLVRKGRDILPGCTSLVHCLCYIISSWRSGYTFLHPPRWNMHTSIMTSGGNGRISIYSICKGGRCD